MGARAGRGARRAAVYEVDLLASARRPHVLQGRAADVRGRAPAITAFLSDHHPGRVPEVLDVDLERGWLLTRDFGDELLTTAPPPHAWVRALESYADLQLAWVDRVDDLLRVGAPDRTLPELERELDVVLMDVDAMLVGHPGGVSEA